MKPNPFVKYVTKEIVEAIDERAQHKSKSPVRFTKLNLSHIGFRWFGMLPSSFKIAWKKRKKFRS
ncbi:YqzE family protein [Salibacterium salarium]|uniref:YqzE family protein n=1 Tax=Salibacterium salarium TaxID=284579 RepID=A0A3R9P5U4_9BACI|nr:YqzE family protein [Salibacterium salarium]RSL30946.1 YqzE family protein [Salibacterium salarium]